MALTNAFYDAVKEKNVRRIRIMMSDSLLVDPTFREFKEMDKVASSVDELYDEHDGRVFEAEEKKWNDDYMSKQMVQIVGNFSHERIEHLKEVVHHLRPLSRTLNTDNYSSSKSTTETKKNRSYQEQKHYDQINGRYREAKIATGAVAGAVVGGVIASAAGITVVGGALAGAVVGGVTVTVITNGGN